MKNLLIATTALVATAGVAAADVSLSGAANFGVINTADAGADTCNVQQRKRNCCDVWRNRRWPNIRRVFDNAFRRRC